jgi:uncharacterized Ntn-hydrolase superfamily protein
MKEILAILDGISRGQTTEEALKSQIRTDYAQFERDLGTFITSGGSAAALH